VSTTLDVLVPDIGDFTDVPVAEVLVAVGDEVAADDPLVVLESDKASMEIPAPQAGTVKELKVEVGSVTPRPQSGNAGPAAGRRAWPRGRPYIWQSASCEQGECDQGEGLTSRILRTVKHQTEHPSVSSLWMRAIALALCLCPRKHGRP
jgi:hypothetical protein